MVNGLNGGAKLLLEIHFFKPDRVSADRVEPLDSRWNHLKGTKIEIEIHQSQI